MLIRAWRFLSLVFTALVLGMTFAHVLELPAKMEYPAFLYLSIHRTLYVAFGVPNLGAFLEIGAVFSLFVLALLIRRRRRAFWRTLLAAIGVTAALVVCFIVIEPANVAMRSMTLETPPPDFAAWRERWEYGHVVRFVLHLLSFISLVLSLLPSRPAESDWSEGTSSNTITPTRDRARQWHRSS